MLIVESLKNVNFIQKMKLKSAGQDSQDKSEILVIELSLLRTQRLVLTYQYGTLWQLSINCKNETLGKC